MYLCDPWNFLLSTTLVYLLSFIPEECEWGGVLGSILTEFLISGLYFCLVFGQKLRCKEGYRTHC